MLADEQYCDDVEYEEDKKECEHEENLASEFYTDIEVEKVKHFTKQEIERREKLKLRQIQVQKEAKENLMRLQELNKKRLYDQGKLPNAENYEPPKFVKQIVEKTTEPKPAKVVVRDMRT